MSGQILQERAGDVVTLRISNPEKLNALDHAMWLALGDTLRTLAADPDLRSRLGAGARVLSQRFGWESIAAQTAALFAETVT